MVLLLLVTLLILIQTAPSRLFHLLILGFVVDVLRVAKKLKWYIWMERNRNVSLARDFVAIRFAYDVKDICKMKI